MQRLIAALMLAALPGLGFGLGLGLAGGISIGTAGPARAQEGQPGAASDPARAQTLADIRQELSVLYVEIQRLKRELSTTAGAPAQPVAGSILERVNLLEAELARLTARIERLQNRIERIVADGTRRIGDLEFRLVELEGGDVGKLGETTTLGGVEPGDEMAPPTTPQPPQGTDDAPELAVGERDDFERAKAALEAGDALKASQLLARFNETYPGSPLAGEADFLRGEALEKLGDTANAARAYLSSFSGAPTSARAPEALYRLGLMLGRLGQTNEACIALGEVPVRFPDAAVVADAAMARQDLGCP